jgi:hypothetical protein
MMRARHTALGRAAVLLTAVLLLAPLSLWGDTGPDHQVGIRPTPMGTTGGNIKDRSRLFCCSGTLGALVQDAGGQQYVLSNNHVLARTNLATLGEAIIQPGLIDQTPVCTMDAGDTVADLAQFVPIRFKAKASMPTNTVDAAIATVRSGLVDASGTILDVGVINAATLDPSLSHAVKKSGRTTGLTTGTITAVAVTVDVTYNKTCGVGSQVARFVNQFLVEPGGFSAGGDSGSVIVEDLPATPRAVGLLFAGSSSVTVANPINAVMTAFAGKTLRPVGATTTGGRLERFLAWFSPPWRVAQSHAAPPLPGHVDPAAVAAVTRVKERHEAQLLALPGVHGVGVGLPARPSGQPTIEVYVKQATDETHRLVPAALDGVDVRIVETGEVVAR